MSLWSKLEGLRQIWHFDNRWYLLVSRLLFRSQSVLLYRLGSLEVLVDHRAGDANGIPQLLTKAIYSDHLISFPRDHPLRVLDIGANTGGFIVQLAHAGFSLERTVCVELNPRTCTRLRFNLERNFACPITVVNAALCGVPRIIRAELGSGSVADSIYDRSFNATGSAIQVEGRTFDDLCGAHWGETVVDICKIDVEKAEYEVFESTSWSRLKQCRFVVVEIHALEGRRPQSVIEAIVGVGFRLKPLGADPTVHVFENQLLVLDEDV